jgi:L-2-hydroxyglutarate oxidase
MALIQILQWSPMEYDIIIIGGGLVGLATALKLSQANPYIKVAILEKEAEVAKHQSGNNSGVIHSGIYYKPGSLKAKNCASGRRALIDFCDEHKIKYELCGKIIIAKNLSELPELEKIYLRGLANGLGGIKKLSREEIMECEPSARGLAGIFVPQSGIVDFKQIAKTYSALFLKNGGNVHVKTKVLKIARKAGCSEIVTDGLAYKSRVVINCAGLYSDKVAMMNRKNLYVRIIPFRGEYYKIKTEKRGLVKNLIYPVPDPKLPFLGVHFTRRINGEIEAGPNAVLAFKREGYNHFSFSFKEFAECVLWPGMQKVAWQNLKSGAGEFYRSFSKKAFTKELKKLVPEINEDDLLPAGAGVRAQAISRAGKIIDDFLILEDAFQIDLVNAPSPAATASLAIGEKIAGMALKKIA